MTWTLHTQTSFATTELTNGAVNDPVTRFGFGVYNGNRMLRVDETGSALRAQGLTTSGLFGAWLPPVSSNAIDLRATVTFVRRSEADTVDWVVALRHNGTDPVSTYQVQQQGTTLRLQRVLNGATPATLATTTTVIPAAGMPRVLTLEVTGASPVALAVYLDGSPTPVLTFTDANPTRPPVHGQARFSMVVPENGTDTAGPRIDAFTLEQRLTPNPMIGLSADRLDVTTSAGSFAPRTLTVRNTGPGGVLSGLGVAQVGGPAGLIVPSLAATTADPTTTLTVAPGGSLAGEPPGSCRVLRLDVGSAHPDLIEGTETTYVRLMVPPAAGAQSAGAAASTTTVTLTDANGAPQVDRVVYALSADPSIASVEPARMRTNAAGQAQFRVTAERATAGATTTITYRTFPDAADRHLATQRVTLVSGS